MPQTVTEFIYLKLKPSVKPEDPDNDEGSEFLDTLKATKNQSGHQGSAWGRSIEDEDCVVWAIDWDTAHPGGSRATLLTRFLAPDTKILRLTTILNPPPSTTETFTKNPVTELCVLNFPTSATPEEHKQIDAHLIAFRSALLDKSSDHLKPKSWSTGLVDRPGVEKNHLSPSGEVYIKLLVVGWESREVHMEAKKTDLFKEVITPLRQWMVPPIHELDMRHVSFKKL